MPDFSSTSAQARAVERSGGGLTGGRYPVGILPRSARDRPGRLHDVLSERTDMSAGIGVQVPNKLGHHPGGQTREDMWWWKLGVRPSPASTSWGRLPVASQRL